MTFHIAYACDDNYVEQTKVSVVSVLENHKADSVAIYLVEDHIKQSGLDSLRDLVNQYGQKLMIVPIDELLSDIPLKGDANHPRTIYAKIFLGRICSNGKILYLDSDTIVVSSLNDLWNSDMTDCYIGGVRMPYSVKLKEKMGLDAETDYLCDGVMLLNLDAWRKDGMEEKCLRYIREKGGQPLMLSEQTVNFAAGKHIRVLPPEYNLMSVMILWNADQISKLYNVDNYYEECEIKKARNSPVIIHYLNELYIRPWFGNSDHPYRKKYLLYRKHAGINDILPDGYIGRRTKLVRILNKWLPFFIFNKIYQSIRKCRGY